MRTRNQSRFILDGQSLVGASHVSNPLLEPHKLAIYDDGFGPLYLYGMEFGPTLLVRASSADSALEIAYDEMPTIGEDEVHEAYGFDTREQFEDACEADQLPDLVEGYYFQANASGTGIVNPGYYEWIRDAREVDAMIEAGELSLLVEDEETGSVRAVYRPW